MKRSKNLLRKGAALAAMSTVLVSQAPLINAFAYGEADGAYPAPTAPPPAGKGKAPAAVRRALPQGGGKDAPR